jgi:hypothetical protein
VRQAFYYSIASAAVAGLLFGGVMKLGPDALAETGGPRMLITGTGQRVIAPEYGSGGVLFASRNGEIPEYVIGTDWTQPMDVMLAGDVYGYDYAEADYGYAEPAPEPAPQIDHAAFAAPVKISSPPKRVSYPSIDGDVVGDHEDQGAALAEVVEAREEDPEHLPS